MIIVAGGPFGWLVGGVILLCFVALGIYAAGGQD